LVFTLTVRGTRSTGNVFVHQRATEIVHACLQELPNAINADLYQVPCMSTMWPGPLA
jgi:hypothetical protein